MKAQQEDVLFTKEELLIGALLFSIYLACLLQLDSEWVMWYGFVMLGTHPPEDLPPPLFSDPLEAFQVASVLGLLGLIALVLLMVVAGEVRFGWLSWLKARLSKWGSQGAR